MAEELIEQFPEADWTDMDLLTRDEAGSKLDWEIAAEQARLDALGTGDSPDENATCGLLERRLAGMKKVREYLLSER